MSEHHDTAQNPAVEEEPAPVGIRVDDAERQRRWRLMLGADTEGLHGEDQNLGEALGMLYDAPDPGQKKDRFNVGRGRSAPKVARWLGDIRGWFPSSVVQVMQKDAIERLDLKQLLLEPEMMTAVEPDIHLVSTLASLGKLLPEQSRETARQVVRTVVKQVEERIAERTRSAVKGAINRASRTNRPKPADINWNRTIAANLKNYLPEQRTIVPERLIGYGRRSTSVERDIVLLMDQSGSMATSVVYGSIFGAVMASIRAVRTKVVAYDTAVVDLTDDLDDPVDVIFGTQLGGGNDTNAALDYVDTLIERPPDTIMVLISDLYEGAGSEEMIRRLRVMHDGGVAVVVLLALDDEGAPSYDHQNAAALAALGIPAFACTPDAFPDLLAAALAKEDLVGFAERYAGERQATAG